MIHLAWFRYLVQNKNHALDFSNYIDHTFMDYTGSQG